MFTEGLPATMVADGERSGAAAVMEDHRLLMMYERIFNGGNKLIAKEAILREVGFVFEVDDVDICGSRTLNGELI